MMSLQTIRALSDEAAQVAKRSKLQPWFPMTVEDITVDNLKLIPHLGSYTPKHWEKTDVDFFADSSGFGRPDEPAMTPDQLVSAMRAHYVTHPASGYAITEVGQFQLYITAFTRLPESAVA